jgi:DNA mismatch endonuclease (patch repair protein)
MGQMSAAGRSRIMSAIRKRDTKPELAVRRHLHRHGLRYMLHGARLPGCPDLVFPSRRAVVFVHGCFWHRCPHCAAGKKEVRSNTAYWLPKLRRNQERDARVKAELEAEGWAVHTIWECEVGQASTLAKLAKAIDAKRYLRVKESHSSTAAGAPPRLLCLPGRQRD